MRLVTTSIAIAAWCLLAGPGASPAATEPIRIAGSVAQTGPYRLLGQDMLRGFQLCVQDASAAGGVLGRPIELVMEDDQSDPAVAVQIWEDLLTERTADALPPEG